MVVELDEGDVRFTFDVAAAVRWESHLAWTRGVGSLPAAQPVDFAVLLPDDGICLFEATDFRGYSGALRAKVRSGTLAARTAAKFRDSLAGLAWATGRSDASIGRIGGALFRRQPPKVLCVAWLDEDGGDPAIADAIRGEIEHALPRRMVCEVLVTSLRLESDPRRRLPWLDARSLSRK